MPIMNLINYLFNWLDYSHRTCSFLCTFWSYHCPPSQESPLLSLLLLLLLIAVKWDPQRSVAGIYSYFFSYYLLVATKWYIVVACVLVVRSLWSSGYTRVLCKTSYCICNMHISGCKSHKHCTKCSSMCGHESGII